jgi:hypothetical protein
MNELPSDGRTLVRIEVHSDKVWIIDAVCINCNKRFKSMRAVSMHLKMTATRHAVNFISYGNYDKNTGLREPQILTPHASYGSQSQITK